MPAPSAAVRVFISSTFRDMHAERDHLVTVVFPELRERVEALGFEFFDVDLRWGVPEKDADGEKANSWEYCRKWIDEVEPFFVCVLGQRYGYQPEPDELRDPADQARQRGQRRSITEMEVRHAVLDSRRKRRSFFYLRATEVQIPPSSAPMEERTAFDEFVDPADMRGKLDTLRADIRACGRPVRDYSCRWTGRGFDDLDQFGDLVLEDLWSGVLRDERYVGKEIWWRALGADPAADARYTDDRTPIPPALAERIVALARPAPPSALDAERQQMETFAASRLRWFHGREEELEQLGDFIASAEAEAPRLAVVAARSGQGKSSLLARLGAQIDTSRHFVITHFVGATERSATAYSLVERLLGELDRSAIVWPDEPRPEGGEPRLDFNSLCLRLAQRLGDYAGERRIVILLDALNQLSDGHDLHWLPVHLGPGVRVVASCIEDPDGTPDGPEQRVLHALSTRRPDPLRVSLGELREEDVREIASAYLGDYCHQLDSEHMNALCAIPQARNPLYLQVMLNELRTLGGNDLNHVVPERIAAMPKDHPDTVSLFCWVLQRLEVFGADAVRWWCLCLLHGRVGMSSRELTELLQRRLGGNEGRTALLIERGLRRYLQRRGGQLDFFHGQLRRAVMSRYGAVPGTSAVHGELAAYFVTCARGASPSGEWTTDGIRGYSECVFHLVHAGQCREAAGLLTDFSFVLHKLRVGLLEGTLEDYEMVRREASADVDATVSAWATFIHEGAHILRRADETWPADRVLLQLAAEHADDSPVTVAAERWLAAGHCDWYWLRRPLRPPHVRAGQCRAVLEGHASGVKGALVLQEGRILSWAMEGPPCIWNRDGTLLKPLLRPTGMALGFTVTDAGRLVSWSAEDGILIRSQDGTLLRQLKDEEGPVVSVVNLSGGRMLSRSLAGTLCIRDSEGTPLIELAGHQGPVYGAIELRDGRILSMSKDGTLRIWARDGRALGTLTGHSEAVIGALELRDGRILSWSFDGTFRLWGGKGESHGTVILDAPSTPGAVEVSDRACRVWPHGAVRFLDKSGSWVSHWPMRPGGKNSIGALELADGSLLMWTNDEVHVLDTGRTPFAGRLVHAHGVRDAIELQDGTLVTWKEEDAVRDLRVWDTRGTLVNELHGHTGLVEGALELADGGVLSWSQDGTLRIWDKDQRPLERPPGHAASVRGALELLDGQILSWSEGAGVPTVCVWTGDGTLDSSAAPTTDRIEQAMRLQDGTILTSRSNTIGLLDSAGSPLWKVTAHRNAVLDARELRDGRVLWWSLDGDVCALDRRGPTVVAFKGHLLTPVWGAIELKDGRILSWSEDGTLRLWDRSGTALAVMRVDPEHSENFSGAVELADGRVLSWSGDACLVLWSCSGKRLRVLRGHTASVGGASELRDGRILSWSGDKTIRIWSATGESVGVLAGHDDAVLGAVECDGGGFLSWSEDSAGGVIVRMWDSAGAPTGFHRYPDRLAPVRDYVMARHKAECIRSNSALFSKGASAILRMMTETPGELEPGMEARWHGGSDCRSQLLKPDGRMVVSLDDGQVCVLQLFYGNRAVGVEEWEGRFATGRRKPEPGREGDPSLDVPKRRVMLRERTLDL